MTELDKSSLLKRIALISQTLRALAGKSRKNEDADEVVEETEPELSGEELVRKELIDQQCALLMQIKGLSKKKAFQEATEYVNQVAKSKALKNIESDADPAFLEVVNDIKSGASSKKDDKTSKKHEAPQTARTYKQEIQDTLEDPSFDSSFLPALFGTYVPTRLLRNNLKIGVKPVTVVNPATGEVVKDEKGQPKIRWQIASNFTEWQNNGNKDPLFREFFQQFYVALGRLATSRNYRHYALKMSKEGLSQPQQEFELTAIVNNLLYGISADDPLTVKEEEAISKKDKYRQEQSKSSEFIGNKEPYEFDAWLEAKDTKKSLSPEQRAYYTDLYKKQKEGLGSSAIANQGNALLARLQQYVTTTHTAACSQCGSSMWSYSNPLFPNATSIVFNNEILPLLKANQADESIVRQWSSNPFECVGNIRNSGEIVCGGLLKSGIGQLNKIYEVVRRSDKEFKANPMIAKNQYVTITLPDIEPDDALARAKVLDDARHKLEEVKEDFRYTAKTYNVLTDDFLTIAEHFCAASKRNADFKNCRPLYQEIASDISSVFSALTKKDKSAVIGTYEEYPCPSLKKVINNQTYYELRDEETDDASYEGTCPGLIRCTAPADDIIQSRAKAEQLTPQQIRQSYDDERVTCPVCSLTYTVKMLKEWIKEGKISPAKKMSRFMLTQELDRPNSSSSEGRATSRVDMIEAPKTEPEVKNELEELKAIKTLINTTMENRTIPIDVEGKQVEVKIDNLGDHLVHLMDVQRGESGNTALSVRESIEALQDKSPNFIPLATAMGFVAPFTICNTCGNYHIRMSDSCEKAFNYGGLDKLTMKAAKEELKELKKTTDDRQRLMHLPDFDKWEDTWKATVRKVESDLRTYRNVLGDDFYPANGILNTEAGSAVYRVAFSVRFASAADDDEFGFHSVDDELTKRQKDKAQKAPRNSIVDDDDLVYDTSSPTIEIPPDTDSHKSKDEQSEILEDEFEAITPLEVTFDQVLWKDAVKVLSDTTRERILGKNQRYYKAATDPSGITKEHLETLKQVLPELEKVTAVVHSPVKAVQQVFEFVLEVASSAVTREL